MKWKMVKVIEGMEQLEPSSIASGDEDVMAM